MNVSINNIAFDVIEMYRANYKDTDSLDIRQVYHWVNTGRAFFVKQRLDKNIFAIYEEEIQTIDEMEIVDSGTTDIVMSSLSIPATISRKGYHGTITKVSQPFFTSMGDPVFSGNPIQVVSPKRFKRVGHGKFNGNFYYATIGKGKKLYFKPYTLTGANEDHIAIDGVFQNPLEVMALNGIEDVYNADYPFNSDLIKDLVKLIVSEKFQLVLQQVEDKNVEDGRDSTTK